MGTQSKASLVLNLVLVVVVFSETVKPVVSADDDNIVLSKRSVMSSNNDKETQEAIIVNNGHNINTRSLPCSLTTDEENPWWAVDLGKEYLVTGVKIYISNNDVENFASISIRVGNLSPNTFNHSKKYPVSDLIECNTYGGDKVGGDTIDVVCIRYTLGRFLFIVDDKIGILQPCEVEVFFGEREYVCLASEGDQNSAKVQTPLTCYEYMGCYKDFHGRDIGNLWNSMQMTPKRCFSRCDNKISGLQDKRGCYCGDSYGSFGAYPTSSCDDKCTGDQSLTCGGYGANSVYRKLTLRENMCMNVTHYLSNEDNCNECFCHDNNVMSCTDLKCDSLDDGCMYGQTKLNYNDTFLSWNKCYQCQCKENNGAGVINCHPHDHCKIKRNNMVCSYDGKEYRGGFPWKSKDGCNVCLCRNNAVSCSEKPECLEHIPQNLEQNANCTYSGNLTGEYLRGTHFMTLGCRYCYCARYGVIACAYSIECMKSGNLNKTVKSKKSKKISQQKSTNPSKGAVSSADHAGIGTGCLSLSVISTVLYLLALL